MHSHFDYQNGLIRIIKTDQIIRHLQDDFVIAT